MLLDFNKLSHQQSFSLKGTWWLSGNARRKVSGTLHYSTEEPIRLEVDGWLRKALTPFLYFPFEREVILGETDDGKRMSLHNCFARSASGGRTTYLVNIVIANAHVRKLSSLRFDSLFATFTDLEEWVGIPPYTLDFDFNFRLTKPPLIKISVPRERITIEIGHSVFTEVKRSQWITTSYENVITVKPDRRVGWQRFNRITHDLQRLLMLLSGEPNSVRRRGGVLRTGQDTTEPQTVYVFQSLTRQTQTREVLRPEMIFPQSEIEERRDEVFQKWFAVSKNLRPMFDVLFAEFRTRSAFLEAHFFHIAQSLEAFHRKQIEGVGGRHMSKKSFRGIHKRIVGAMPPHLPKKLFADIAGAVSRANDLSFQDRLNHLFDMLEPETVAFITTDRDRVISAIKDTRNQFTHVEKRKRSKAFHRMQWREASDKALAVLFIHMLKLCGFPEAAIRARMKESRRFGTNPFEFAVEPS